MNQKSDI